MKQTDNQKKLSILYEAQEELLSEKNPSEKKQFIINLMIEKLEKQLIDVATKGIYTYVCRERDMYRARSVEREKERWGIHIDKHGTILRYTERNRYIMIFP